MEKIKLNPIKVRNYRKFNPNSIGLKSETTVRALKFSTSEGKTISACIFVKTDSETKL